MARLSQKDEINNLIVENNKINDLGVEKYKIINDLKEYFSVMEISEKEKQERVDIGVELFDAILYFFLIYEESYAQNLNNDKYLMDTLETELREIVDNRVGVDDYMDSYLITISSEIVETTNRNYKKNVSAQDNSDGFENSANSLSDIPPKSSRNNVNSNYYTSFERAFNIAKNEANSILNYRDYKRAKSNKMRKKQWVSMKDERVRHDHFMQDDVKVQIDDYFYFPDCVMLFPHDSDNGTINQLANCRCTIKYSR